MFHFANLKLFGMSLHLMALIEFPQISDTEHVLFY